MLLLWEKDLKKHYEVFEGYMCHNLVVRCILGLFLQSPNFEWPFIFSPCVLRHNDFCF
jgi:hypothetical protein